MAQKTPDMLRIEDYLAVLQTDWSDCQQFLAEYDAMLDAIGNVEGHEVPLLAILALINSKSKLPNLY